MTTDTNLLTLWISTRVRELSEQEAQKTLVREIRLDNATVGDAALVVDLPGISAIKAELPGIPLHIFAAANFCSDRWRVEHRRSGFKMDKTPIRTEVFHLPPCTPTAWDISPFNGVSINLRCTERLVLDIATDLPESMADFPVWGHVISIAESPRASAAILALGREVQRGAGADPLFLEERIRSAIRLWLIEKRKVEVRPKAPVRFTPQGMALLHATLRTRCLENPTLAELAAVTGLGVDAFRRAFRTAFRQTPHQYITDLRLSLVRETLARDAATPLHILAPACGFADAPHLVRTFKKRYGWAPKEFAAWTMPSAKG